MIYVAYQKTLEIAGRILKDFILTLNKINACRLFMEAVEVLFLF
jgi:hypothetical protein